MIIDSHNHFWKYHPVSHAWIDDTMSVLKKDFLPNEFSTILEENGVDGTIAIQADQSLNETHALLEMANNYAFIKGVVGWVDLKSEDIADQLASLSQHKKLVGFRHIVQSEPDPNFMQDEKFEQGLSLLEKYGFTYDILIFPHQLESAIKTVETFPNQKFVIDHLAKPYIKEDKIKEWSIHMRTISRQENVMCKLSGMVTEADWHSWSYNDFKPVIDIVVESFGKDRIMFGSDWPVCLLAAEYSDVKGIMTEYIKGFSDTDTQKVMGLNAAKFYGI